MLRTWGGIMDMSMDGSPIIDKHILMDYILTVVGVMADLNQHLFQDGHLHIQLQKID